MKDIFKIALGVCCGIFLVGAVNGFIEGVTEAIDEENSNDKKIGFANKDKEMENTEN